MTTPDAIAALPLAERVAFEAIRSGVETDGGTIDAKAAYFTIALAHLKTMAAGPDRAELAALFDERLTAVVTNGARVQAFTEDGPTTRIQKPPPAAYLKVHIKRAADLAAEMRTSALDSLAERARQRAGDLPDLDTESDDAATKE